MSFPLSSSNSIIRTLVLLALAIQGVPHAFGAGDTNALVPQLEPFRPFIGRTWRGEFKGSTPEKPMIDIARWERALNGQAIRILHSLNQGEYGGETIVQWNREKQAIVYHYFTTAGFTTTGTMTLQNGQFTSHELVTGDADGVKEVKATGELRADGTMISRAQFLKGDKWEPAHEITYREDPKAEVKFK